MHRILPRRPVFFADFRRGGRAIHERAKAQEMWLRKARVAGIRAADARTRRAVPFEDKGNCAIKESAGIGGSKLGSLLGHDEKHARLIVLHGVVANVVDKLDGFRVQLQSFGELVGGSGKILFLATAIPLRVMAFGGIKRG